MSTKTTKEGLCISSDRRIPATIATQFPDNVNKPFWSFKDTNPGDDYFDCYASFKELGCQEYFWQWQSRKLDENLVKRLITSYKQYFKDNPLGEKRFITFSVDGEERIESLGKLYMSIISVNEFAKSQRLHTPPIFEVVHTADSSDGLLRFTNLYSESVSMATDKFKRQCDPKSISIMPVHDFTKPDWYTSVNRFLTEYAKHHRCKVEYFRPLIPRASIADKTGFVAAVLLTKRAIANYHSFAELTGVIAHPIVEASTMMFRGGLNPDNARSFYETYPGARSVTITPSFRFDHDLKKAQAAIEGLNRALADNRAVTYTKEEASTMRKIEAIFIKHHMQANIKMPEFENIADVFETKKQQRKIHPSLRRTFALYSLGVPPEFIGTGRALMEVINSGLSKSLETFYPTIKQDLVKAGTFLNKENLRFLAATDPFWAGVLKDANLIEDYTDTALGPDSTDKFLHRNLASNIFHNMMSKRDFSSDLMECAKLRRALG